MVAMAILAITLAFGVPQINNIVMDNRKVDAMNRLSANLSFARSEAIKRATAVILRPDPANPPNEWQQGWTVFVDVDGNGAITPGAAAGEELRIEDALNLPTTTTIQCGGCPGGDIIYNPDGSIAAVGNITLRLDDTKLRSRSVMTISQIGRINIAKAKPY